MEMGNQYELDNSYPKITKVWTDRSTPIQLDTECPAINVRLRKWKDINSTVIKVERSLIFDIEIYTTAVATLSTPGDITSMALMNKISGMVSAILNYPDYSGTIGLEGIVTDTEVMRYYIADKGDVSDALSGVVGVLEYRANCIEYILPTDSSVAINELTCKILMQDPNYGFFFDYKQLIIGVSATGTTLTNAFFSTKILSISILDSQGAIVSTYENGADFTQSGTTLTATTFTFTSGTNIIART
jgi:hypothetical protein